MHKSPFLNKIYQLMMVRRYSKRTIKSYIYWVKAFINFNEKQHPQKMGVFEVEHFLTHLAVNRGVTVSTQSIALNAIVFLYDKFLEQPLGDLSQFKRASRQAKLPTILSVEEISLLLLRIEPKYKLMASMLYGSGLRRIKLLRLRVNDIDMNFKQVRVWNGKGYKHRITTLAVELIPSIERQIQRVDYYLGNDLENDKYSGIYLPNALSRKYRRANKTLGWQYLFPSSRLSIEPATGLLRRHHIDESSINKAIKRACKSAKIGKTVSSHTLRQSFKKYVPVYPPSGQPSAIQICS